MEFFPLLVLVLAFVLLIVLPARQRKRMAAQTQVMQQSLTVGTPVMTTSGMHGTIAGLGDTTVDIAVAPGVVVTFARQAILEIRRPADAPPAGGTTSGGATGGATAPDVQSPGDDTPGGTGGRPADGTV